MIGIGDRYVDTSGDVWELRQKLGKLVVIRLRDNNIGYWRNGEGLTPFLSLLEGGK